MANRTFYQFRQSYERELVDVYCTIVIGASGAVTSATGAGILSVVKEATAGQYTINLQDNFNALRDVRVVTRNAAGISAAGAMGIVLDQVSSATAPLVRIQMANAGVATNPASADVLLLHITVKNSST